MARIQQAHYDYSLRQNRPPMTEAGRDFTLGMQALKRSRSLTTSQMWLHSLPRRMRVGSTAKASASMAARNC